VLGPKYLEYILRLWAYTAVHKTKGIRTGMDASDIAVAAGWPGEADKFLEKMIFLGWIEPHPKKDKVFQIHNWKQHNLWVFRTKERSEEARMRANVRWKKEKRRVREALREASENGASSNAPRNAPRTAPFLPLPSLTSPTLTSPSGGEEPPKSLVEKGKEAWSEVYQFAVGERSPVGKPPYFTLLSTRRAVMRVGWKKLVRMVQAKDIPKAKAKFWNEFVKFEGGE